MALVYYAVRAQPSDRLKGEMDHVNPMDLKDKLSRRIRDDYPDMLVDFECKAKVAWKDAEASNENTLYTFDWTGGDFSIRCKPSS